MNIQFYLQFVIKSEMYIKKKKQVRNPLGLFTSGIKLECFTVVIQFSSAIS